VRPFPRLYNNFVENAPFSPTVTLFGVDLMDPYGSAGVRNPFPPFSPVPLGKDVLFSLPTGLTFFREDWGAGYSQSWNLTVERQMRRNLLMRVAYVGNKGNYLQSFRERNAAVYRRGATLSDTDQRRPLYPNYASMVQMVSDGNSHYHSLQVTVDRRFNRNFSFLAFYAFSKSIDDESINAQFTLANPNPYDPGFNRGLSDFDVPHNFRMTGIYDLPWLAGRNGFLRNLAGGWTITESSTGAAAFRFHWSRGGTTPSAVSARTARTSPATRPCPWTANAKISSATISTSRWSRRTPPARSAIHRATCCVNFAISTSIQASTKGLTSPKRSACRCVESFSTR
jgi:hypothetical protein